MASSGDIIHSSPLKVPVVEIVDLLSDDDSSIDEDVDQIPVCDALDIAKDEDDDQWETESFYEDALEGIGDEEFVDDVEACSLEEAHAFRKRLRKVGEDQFIIETVESRTITAKKLCTAFGIKPPHFLDGAPDSAYYPLLGLGISRELSKRVKLPQYNTVDDAVSLLKNSKNIIVLTGAGISTSLGIPDFRSKDTGLYSKLQHLGLNDPQEVFDISLFREDPTIFYSVAKDILPSTNKYSPTHAFIRLLQEKEKLLTNFTQNIDNLEGHAGILPEKLIQCHGSFATASCGECQYKVNGEEIYKDLKAGRVARCDRCIRRLRQAKSNGLKRKRTSNSTSSSKKKRNDYEDGFSEEDYDIATAGVMKPDITFFGEGLPATFHSRLTAHDHGLVDLVIVIGTSLKVAPVSEIPGFLPAHVPQLYISRTTCSHIDFDIDLLGDCDTVVAELCNRAGWDLQHEMLGPASQKIDVQLVSGYASRYSFKAGTA
ncbi:NAD-dependent histone deacetylase sir2 [Toensbergia leucococca]|nr:NAD-dependent histone deacetylase sir2 [Toensbergia leucococca]